MFDGFFPQTLHDFLYNKRLLGFSFLIPGTRENKLLQIIGSHVPRGGEGWGSHMKGAEMFVENFELTP